MASICPVCNGFQLIHLACPKCNTMMDDTGRITDLFGPYSPYRPIDDIKQTDGLIDLKLRICYHVMQCPECGHSESIDVQEQQESTLL